MGPRKPSNKLPPLPGSTPKPGDADVENNSLNSPLKAALPNTRRSAISLDPLPENSKLKFSQSTKSGESNADHYTASLEQKSVFITSSTLRSSLPGIGRRSTLDPITEGNKSITRDDAAHVAGIPPMCLLATQLSTLRYGNTCSYRSSGAMPTGLLDKYLTGDAKPKQFISKAKSSDWGPQEGRITISDAFNRRQKCHNGGFETRKHALDDFPRNEDYSIALECETLKVSLRTIFTDAYKKDPPKYAISINDNSNILKFRQINSKDPYVLNTVFMINLADIEAEKLELKNSELHTSRKEGVSLTKFYWEDPNFRLGKWDDHHIKKDIINWAFPISAQAPEAGPEIIKVIAHTVRDTDLDFFTQPKNLQNVFGKEEKELSEYLTPINMNHGSKDIHSKIEDKKAVRKMENLLYDLNQLEWNNYENLVAQKKEECAQKGILYNESMTANRKPFIERLEDREQISQLVCLVGEATAMELYQGLEINAIKGTSKIRP